jgi:hypothetical protein
MDGPRGGLHDQVSTEAAALGGSEVCWGAEEGDAGCRPRVGLCLRLCGVIGMDEGGGQGGASSRRRVEGDATRARGCIVPLPTLEKKEADLDTVVTGGGAEERGV